MEANTAGSSQIPRAPAGLADRGRGLWRRINQDYELDALELELLHELCRVLDRCDQIAAELKGLKSLATLGSAGQCRVHPLLTALENQQKLADRLATSLGVSLPGASGETKGVGHQRKAVRTRWTRVAKAASVTSIARA